MVLGCGRSGTSLVAGLLHDAGYHLGDRLLGANADNPTGYFEDREVNRVNERLLAPVTSGVVRDADNRPVSARPLAEGERWLAALRSDVELAPLPEAEAALADALRTPAGQPLCRKDPRFTWTLPLWRPLAPAVRVVVFREPLAAARSMAAMAAEGTLGLGVDGALAVWTAAARRVLALSASDPAPWVFLSYTQVLDGSALPRLAAALDLPGLRADRVDRGLRRQPAGGELPADTARAHDRLLERAAA